MAVFKYDNIKISGMSCVIPKNVVETSSYKDIFGDDEVEKFIKMTGITQTRRTKEFQTASDMATSAAHHLLKKKNINPGEIKALVFGTHSPDYKRPASAFVIQKQLGISTDAAVFDISLGCSAAVYGIQVVSSMMVNSDIDKAILVVGDTAGKTTNPKDRASIMLIGEASIAILLEKTTEPVNITSLMRSDGNGYRYLILPAGGYRNLNPKREEEICTDGNPRSLYDSFMQGTSVFTFTITDVPRSIKDFMKITNTKVEDYDSFAFHQANLLILNQIAKKLCIPSEKMPITLSSFGNTSGASPVLTLCDTYGHINKKVIKVMMIGFGVGISWGVTSFEINTSDIFPIIEDDTIFSEGIIKSFSEL